MKLVIKIGGSVLFDGEEIKVDLISHWITVINQLRDQGHKIGIVIGGGSPARRFAKAAKQLGATNSYQDFIGIEAARQNARLFISGLEDAYPDPPRSFQELLKLSANHDLLVVGGFQPGQSTNAVAALFAEHLRADYLFNMSNVSKVYNKDPDNFPDAKAIDKLNYEEFSSILSTNEQLPGTYELFDRIGLDIVERSQIKLVFLNGTQPDLIFDILSGTVKGTVVG